MSKAVVVFILIIVAGMSVVGFWYWRSNQYSKEVLKLEILGPQEVQTGGEIEYLVKFKNNGKVRLENPELTFEYPERVILEGGQNQRTIQKIETIYPGEERIIEFTARAFGKEGDILKASAWLSYQPKNLKARYESKTSFTTRIKSVPLTFEFDLPSKTEDGEDLEFSLNYFSNINYILENLRVKVEYPSGFHFLSSQPKALDETEWLLPTLSAVDGGRITIKGTIGGEEGEEKIFRAQLGIVMQGEFIALKTAAETLQITEPSFFISQLMNGSQNYIANKGDFLHYEIFFKNIGKKAIQKKFLFVELEGDFFDLTTLKSDLGEIGRGDSSIIWDWKKVSDLRFLEAGGEGKVDFWVKIKDGADRKIENPVLKNKITLASTQRIFETKLNSDVQLSQKVYFQEEMFGNTGLIPPLVGTSTTYTVLWQVKNSWNKLENVKVKGILPEYVKPTGKIFPASSKFTFDSQSREVIWNIGEMEAFQGFDEVSLTLAFQIEFIPHPFQKGQAPNLVQEAELLAEDTFTSEIIQAKAASVNTNLPDDKTVKIGDGVVQ